LLSGEIKSDPSKTKGHDVNSPDEGHTTEFPIDGILDLHTFHPRDVKELLPDYLELCRKKGIFEIRIIHGKGTGALRETVHSILRKLPNIGSFRLAGEDEGGWGATLVMLGREDVT
jgi:DNA-nicking Smr family endonuclease